MSHSWMMGATASLPEGTRPAWGEFRGTGYRKIGDWRGEMHTWVVEGAEAYSEAVWVGGFPGGVND